MSQTVLFIELLLVHYAIQTQIEVNCNENVTLKCPVDFNNLKFISVTWFKIHNHRRKGIIRKKKVSGTTQYYNYTREVSFVEEYNMLMLKVTPEDSGRYECGISAVIGGQEMYREVDLVVRVCVTQAHMTTTPVFNTTQSTSTCQSQVAELPVMWAVVGYLAVGFTKVVLSVITIWVISSSTRCCSTRRQQQTW